MDRRIDRPPGSGPAIFRLCNPRMAGQKCHRWHNNSFVTLGRPIYLTYLLCRDLRQVRMCQEIASDPGAVILRCRNRLKMLAVKTIGGWTEKPEEQIRDPHSRRLRDLIRQGANRGSGYVSDCM